MSYVTQVSQECRAEILHTGERVRALLDQPELNGNLSTVTDAERKSQNEAKANIMIAFRHLEDARMRLGKCLQALDGGTSIYDKA